MAKSNSTVKGRKRTGTTAQKKKNKNKGGSTPSWAISVGVVVIAIAAGLALRHTVNQAQSSSIPSPEQVSQEITSFLNSFVCHHEAIATDGDSQSTTTTSSRSRSSYCQDNDKLTFLEPHGRTHRAKQSISKGTVVITIPRALQITELDALRAIRPPIHAKHKMTGKPLDGGAYLAFHLWQRFIQTSRAGQKDTSTNMIDDDNDPLWLYYRTALVTASDEISSHPIFWNNAEDLLKQHSQAYIVLRAHRDMIQSEYKALAQHESLLTLKDYQQLRLMVLTRSFGTGPPGPSEEIKRSDINDDTDDFMSLDEELSSYKESFGVDLSLGGRAMVPILDMYNHHANPNVDWRLDAATGAYVIRASVDVIPKGQMIYDSYGTYTDAHLLAKFGFVNGDGSGHTEASIAAFHRLMNAGLKQQFDYIPSEQDDFTKLMEAQKFVLARYLQFDDGHEECVASDDPTLPAYLLKQVKLQHLMRLAHDPKRWIVTMPPRNPHASPHDDVESGNTKAPSFDRKNIPEFDASKVLSTCRLMVLTNDDYDGHALQKLQSHLEESDTAIIVERQSDTLEYRALLCLARWTGLLMHRFEMTNEKDIRALVEWKGAIKGTKEWYAHQVVMGEVQTLQLVNQLSAAGAHERARAILNGGGGGGGGGRNAAQLPTIRRHPCEWNMTKSLVEQTKYV